jgi:hypothetical protein
LVFFVYFLHLNTEFPAVFGCAVVINDAIAVMIEVH